jgi:ATP-dependent Lhr-like helicase
MGTKFATSTSCLDRILRCSGRTTGPTCPPTRATGCAAARVSRLPERDRLLVESFPHDGREHLVAYGFAGRNAQQTLGLLLTKRMEALGLNPMGFVATDYATLIWGLDPVDRPRAAVFEARTCARDGDLAGRQRGDEADLQGAPSSRG